MKFFTHVITLFLILAPDTVLAEGESIHLKAWKRRAHKRALKISEKVDINKPTQCSVHRKSGMLIVDLGAPGKPTTIKREKKEDPR